MIIVVVVINISTDLIVIVIVINIMIITIIVVMIIFMKCLHVATYWLPEANAVFLYIIWMIKNINDSDINKHYDHP